MNQIYQMMLSRYDLSTEQGKRNAIFEVSQQIVLAGLYRGGFFERAAFYGGTCLRVFYGLDRFSEDMDFSLLSRDESFDFEYYFPAIIEEFALVGREVEISKKDKKIFGRVESAFLKDDTDVYDLSFRTERSIKIKIEVDTRPPLLFDTEQKLLLQPSSFMARCYTLPCLYAGKMHALAFRAWKNRVKGRDWYDFEWYVRRGVRLNWTHLHERIREFDGEEMSPADYLNLLKTRLAETDINMVKRDVLPFVRDARMLDIWSNDYFLQLADMIQWE